jgi:hypothetical protein
MAGENLPELTKFHGKFASTIAKVPVSTLKVENYDGCLGMSLGGGARVLSNASLTF